MLCYLITPSTKSWLPTLPTTGLKSLWWVVVLETYFSDHSLGQDFDWRLEFRPQAEQLAGFGFSCSVAQAVGVSEDTAWKDTTWKTHNLEEIQARRDTTQKRQSDELTRKASRWINWFVPSGLCLLRFISFLVMSFQVVGLPCCVFPSYVQVPLIKYLLKT